MTLEQYFKLSSQPFPKVAAKHALLMTTGLEHVINRLLFAISRQTIALLIAESGCGKSTCLSLLSTKLDAASYTIIDTSMTTLSPFSFISHLSTKIGLHRKSFKGDTAACFIMHLRAQPKRTIILVDEAHMLPDDSLQDLRLLTADNLDQTCPFSLLLVGQPLLRDRLAEPLHYALWQRIGVKLRLHPLSELEVAPFIQRHLTAAGASSDIFLPEAISDIFHHSRGIHRIVQNIAVDSMIVAMEAHANRVDSQAVSQAIIDMELNS